MTGKAEKVVMLMCCRKKNIAVLMIILIFAMFTTVMSQNILKKYTYSFSGASVECGTPFYLTIDLSSSELNLKNIYIEIPSEYTINGDYNQITEFYEDLINSQKPPRPLLQILSTELLVNEEERKVFRMLLTGSAEGIMNFKVILADDFQTYSQDNLPIRFVLPENKIKALISRKNEIIQDIEKMAGNRYWENLRGEYFGCSMPSINKVYEGDQYIIHHMIARKLNPDDKLSYSGSFYYPPLYSKVENLSFLPTYLVNLEDEYYMICEDLLIIKITPELTDETDNLIVNVYHPRVVWEDSENKEHENISYANENVEVEYLKLPTTLKVLNGLDYYCNIENISVKSPDSNTLNMKIESESIIVGNPLNIEATPSDAKITLFNSNIEKHEYFNRVVYEYNFEYLIDKKDAGFVELKIPSYKYFDLKSNATITLDEKTLVYEVVEYQGNSGNSEVFLGLNGIREKTSEDISRALFDEGVKYYLEEDYDMAFKTFGILVNRFPDSADVRYNLGLVYSKKTDIWEVQREFYRSALLRTEEDVVQNIKLIQKHYYLTGQSIYEIFRFDRNLFIILTILSVSVFVLSMLFLYRKKRMLYALTLIVSIAIACFCLFHIIGANSNPEYAVVSFSSPLYAGPKYDYPIIKNSTAGDMVKIVEAKKGFKKVLFDDGIYYWIDSENLKSLF